MDNLTLSNAVFPAGQAPIVLPIATPTLSSTDRRVASLIRRKSRLLQVIARIDHQLAAIRREGRR